MSLIFSSKSPGYEAWDPKCADHAGLVNLVKRDKNGQIVQDIYLDMEDFLGWGLFVLTNKDLKKDDPRLQFLAIVKKMKVGKGWNKGKKRIKEAE